MERGGSWGREGLSYAILAALVILCVALPFVAPEDIFQFTIILALGCAGVGVALLLEAGLLSFGHALFYGIGGYAAAALAPLLPRAGGALLVLGALGGGIAAAVVGSFMMRYRGVFFAMLNLALSMVAYTMLLKLYGLSGGSEGLSIEAHGILGRALTPAGFGRTLFYGALAGVVLIGVLLGRYRRSAAGWGLGAVRDREVRVEYLGVSARRLVFQAYVISGVLGGFGGAIAALAVGHVAPDAFFWTTSATLTVIAVLGGSGVIGPFLGAALYELLSVSAARFLSTSWEVLLGAVILLAIRFAPEGFAGLPKRLRALVRPGSKG